MKQAVTITVVGAAILAAAATGCSSNKVSTPNGTVASAGSSNTKVLIDGQDQKIQGQVVCAKQAGAINIAIGGATAGVGASLTDADPPQVQSVALGSVNGMPLGYSKGASQGSAQVSKDGSAYKISGTAIGMDMSNPMQNVTKPFEIDVACP